MNIPEKPQAAMPSSFMMEVKQISLSRLPYLWRSPPWSQVINPIADELLVLQVAFYN